MQSKFNCDELHYKQVNAWTPSVFTFSDLVRSVFFINFTIGNENLENFAVQGGAEPLGGARKSRGAETLLDSKSSFSIFSVF